jgi:pyridoxal phosphate enzyme (YggS family)
LPDDLARRLATVRHAVDETAARVGRDPASIAIVAVTKTFPAVTVAAALAAGLEDVGENYVQEATAKRALLAGGVWHLIGGLQRNKVRAAVAAFDWIHTIDSAEIAAALGVAAEHAGRRLRVLVQVNVAGDPRKRGVAPAEVPTVAGAVFARPALALEGLMTVPPIADKPADSRPYFARLRDTRDRTQNRLGVELPHLSMGMSDDFLIAVEEGATLLRLGRVLFGARGPGTSRPGSSVGGEGS